MRYRTAVFLRISLFLSALVLFLSGVQPSFGDERSGKPKKWMAYLGGEWDFLEDKGPPLDGKDWQEIQFGLGRVDKKRFSLLYHHRVAGRTDNFDQVMAGELYLKVLESLWFRTWFGGSFDADFVYQLRSDTELTYYFKNFAFSAEYSFIDYKTTNIHVGAPSLQYFWKNATFMVKYLSIFDKAEDHLFHAGQLRIENRFTDRWIYPFFGIVIGERIFGVFSLQQSGTQDGLLIFGGNRMSLTKNIDWILQASYAREDPGLAYLGVGTSMLFRF